LNPWPRCPPHLRQWTSCELRLSHGQRDLPDRVRALAVAFFYAIGTGIGGVGGPWLLGVLIDTGSRESVFGGYLLGRYADDCGRLIAARFGVAAERKPLESVAPPLSVVD
jgi:hypothetical protein